VWSFWIGVALLLSAPLSVLLVLVVLHFYLRWTYLYRMVRIFQEKPLFIVPRGQPIPDAEEVVFTTADGLRLKGSYFKTPARRKGVILFGLEFGSNRWACRPYCDHLIAGGYDIFAFDPRNQGDSDRQPGYEPLQWVTEFDVRDMKAALAYLKARADADPRGIGFFGISKGAGSALLAFARERHVLCFVTDGVFGTFTTLVPYMRQWFRIYNKHYVLQGLLPSWYYGMLGKVGLGWVEQERKCRFPLLESALARGVPRPVLMIHGGGDTYIKPEMARALYELLTGAKELWLVEGAKHNQALQVAGEEYRRRVLEFFDAHLAAPPEKDLSLNGAPATQPESHESRTDSLVVPSVPLRPAAPAARDSGAGVGEWGSGTQLPCS
jgi:pimeloyl-ACP methyl ester carboxylesterase